MELFETFDRNGRSLGLVPRSEVHARGLWHRSAQVFVFDREGRLLMQQRSAHKDLYGDLWDYSVGEHLTPGESFFDAACRGLREELSIVDVVPEPIGLNRWYEQRGENYHDAEIQQAFSVHYDGMVHPDLREVQDYRWRTLDEVQDLMSHHAATLTPWFINDVIELGILGRSI